MRMRQLCKYLQTLFKTSVTTCDITWRFVAHRGANNAAPNNKLPHLPENTLPALREAYSKGAQFVECDVHLTADGEIVVLHDETLARTARFNAELATTLTYEKFLKVRNQKITELSYKEIVSQVDVGSYSDDLDKKYQRTKIPLLAEFLAEINNKKLVIELKAGDMHIITALLDLLKTYMSQYHLKKDQLIFISFDFELIKSSKKTFPEYKHLLLTIATPDPDEVRPDPENPEKTIGLYHRIQTQLDLNQYIDMVKKANLDGLDVEYDSKLIDHDFMQRIRTNKLMSVVWTYPKDDNIDMAQHMLAVGADLINTNQPEYIFEELKNQVTEILSKRPH